MKDLKLDQDGDLVIKDNDLALVVSDEQHKEHLLTTEKGAIKQFPGIGVGLFTYLEAEDVAGLLREIAIQFSADGMKVKKVSVQDTKLIHNAEYK
jgi:hypothetical protein